MSSSSCVLGEDIVSFGNGSALTDKRMINYSFSLCYCGMKIGGDMMVLGTINPLFETVFSHSDANGRYYFILISPVRDNNLFISYKYV